MPGKVTKHKVKLASTGRLTHHIVFRGSWLTVVPHDLELDLVFKYAAGPGLSSSVSTQPGGETEKILSPVGVRAKL